MNYATVKNGKLAKKLTDLRMYCTSTVIPSLQRAAAWRYTAQTNSLYSASTVNHYYHNSHRRHSGQHVRLQVKRSIPAD